MSSSEKSNTTSHNSSPKPHKRDIINTAATVSGLYQCDAHPVVNAFLDQIIIEVARHKHLEIRDFGTFYTVTRKGRKIRDFKKDKVVTMGDSYELRFKPAKLFKKAIKAANNDVKDDK